MFWFYLLNGIAVLAKGPVAPALAGLTIIFYLAGTGDWKLLKNLEIPRGVLIACIVCLPWHFAEFLKQGLPWLNAYVGTHILGRAFAGVFGDRGTFDYFLGPLGYGMWPWVCLVPVALAYVALTPRAHSREEKVRLMFAVWAISGFAFFVFVQTKFRHYILPAVPALAVVAGFWLDDLWAGRVRGARAGILIALGLFLLPTVDFVMRQERIINLYIFRYDRPWPYGPPWSLDFSEILFAFAVLFGVGLLALLRERWRPPAIVALLGVGVTFQVFVTTVLLPAASPHWGQRSLFEEYYAHRGIHGADIIYYGPHALETDWASGQDLEVRSVIPDTLRVGDPMKITWELRNAQDGAQEKGELAGTVSRLDVAGDRFFVNVPASERTKIQPFVDQFKNAKDENRRFLYVNADRMIGWQLNWKGENFYSGGEIYNKRIPDMVTCFSEFNGDNDKELLEYLKPRTGQGRKFWVVSEIGSIPRLQSVLPTPTAKQTFEGSFDHSSNKFGIARFTLDNGPETPTEPVIKPPGLVGGGSTTPTTPTTPSARIWLRSVSPVCMTGPSSSPASQIVPAPARTERTSLWRGPLGRSTRTGAPPSVGSSRRSLNPKLRTLRPWGFCVQPSLPATTQPPSGRPSTARRIAEASSASVRAPIGSPLAEVTEMNASQKLLSVPGSRRVRPTTATAPPRARIA
jgi:hypothetical protein